MQHKQKQKPNVITVSRRYESVVREREDLRSRLDLSGSNSNGPVTEQKYQVCYRPFVCVCPFRFLVGWRRGGGEWGPTHARMFVWGMDGVSVPLPLMSPTEPN